MFGRRIITCPLQGFDIRIGELCIATNAQQQRTKLYALRRASRGLDNVADFSSVPRPL